MMAFCCKQIPLHMIVGGVSLCIALYMYMTWKEMTRMDAKILAVYDELAKVQQKLIESARQPHPEGNNDAVDAVIKAMFPSVGRLPGSAVIEEEEDDDDYDDDDDDDDDDDEGDEYDDDEFAVDEQHIRDMLIDHLDKIDEGEEKTGGCETTDAGGEETEDAAAAAAAAEEAKDAEDGKLDELRSLKLEELRKRCKDLGIDSKGTKDVLIERLRCETPPAL